MFESIGLSAILLIIGSLLVSMVIHEYVHGFVAYQLGDDTAADHGRLTLNPLSHIDPFTTVLLPVILITIGAPPLLAAKPVPFNPHVVRFGEYGAALVGIAGPISNLLLAALTALLIRVGGVAVGTDLFNAMDLFMSINIALFVFNMIPFPPLDGSRLLYAFAPESVQRVMLQIESFGLLGIFTFIFVGYPFIAPIIIDVNTAIRTFLLQ